MEILKDKTSEEIAYILYEKTKDMDFADYEETKEQDIAMLEDSLENLKGLALYNEWATILYNTLQLLN